MLPATQFDESNFTFTKPPGMTDEECSDLRVWRGQDTSGSPVIISKWNFSKEDLEEIQKNNCIYLTIVGNGMPPVSLQTENPFTNVET
jgi:hypothetical protein